MNTQTCMTCGNTKTTNGPWDTTVVYCSDCIERASEDMKDTITLTIINQPGGETETIHFPSKGAAVTFWTNRAYELTRKGWTYQDNDTLPEDVLSKFVQGDKSVTAYLG